MAKMITKKQAEDYFFELDCELRKFEMRYPNINPFVLYGVNEPHKEEREDNEMTYNVQIAKTEDKILEEYWVMRGVKSIRGEKKVILERESERYPKLSEIAQFLSDSGADFVSVEHNFRFGSGLPFC